MNRLLKAFSVTGLLFVAFGGFAQETFYPVTMGEGNGIRFWESDNYKIHMGNTSLYHYGPVTGYSIKSNMNVSLGRGWTWGIVGQTPIAALNNEGTMQIQGDFRALGKMGVGTSAPYTYSTLDVTGQYAANAFDSQLHLHTVNNATGMFLGSHNATYGVISQGSHYYSGGNFKAVANYSTGIVQNNGYIHMISDAGLIAGNTFNPTERLTVSNDGNIGVGTTTPDFPLDVERTGDVRIISGISYNEVAGFRNDAGGGILVSVDSNKNPMIKSTYTGTDLIFGTRTSATDYERMRILDTGNVGIGTTTPSSKLEVDGTITSEEVKVQVVTPPDYVFAPDYQLLSLKETEEYIQANSHLPEIPSAKEMEANGVELGEMNMLLLKKIEELTLHQIEQNKRIDKLTIELMKVKTDIK